MEAADFLRLFYHDDGYLTICVGHPSRASFHRIGDLPASFPQDQNVWFGPAMRKEPTNNQKPNILGSIAVWADDDKSKDVECTLPPSIIVQSGHGWHLYWLLRLFLTDVQRMEGLNQIAAADLPSAGDHCWDANRLLRVPGTLNNKGAYDPKKAHLPVAPVKLVRFDPSIRYDPEDFDTIARLMKQKKGDVMRRKIVSGDTRGYDNDRSRRDMAIVRALVKAGASDDLVKTIFTHQKCGDKYREHNAPEHYLELTITKAREAQAEEGERASDAPANVIQEHEDGYYVEGKFGLQQLSTFIWKPKLLLDGSMDKVEDVLVTDVVSGGQTWEDVPFPRKAFTDVRNLDANMHSAAWMWHGGDTYLRMMLPYLYRQIVEQGLPRVRAVQALGLYNVEGEWLFIGDRQVLAADRLWEGFTGPVAALPQRGGTATRPTLDLLPGIDDDGIELVAKFLPNVNEPEVVWPMIGWYAASIVKPWIELQHYRFPTLSVVGQKGTGKTSLIQRAFLPLLGQVEPKSYDADTTPFVILSILGSTNAMPVAFSEIRMNVVAKFVRFALLAYDTGHNPRGRSDQTTVDYPLSAPFSLDGEDMIADEAVKQRLVVARLAPGKIEEGSQAYQTFKFLRENVPAGFGRFFIQYALNKINSGDALRVLELAKGDVFDAFPQRLPDRVRNNHIVAMFGIRMFCEATGARVPHASVLKRSIGTVFNLKSDRSGVAADRMVEDAAGACTVESKAFQWTYEPESRTFWFQMSSTHNWWLRKRRQEGRDIWERDAVQDQIVHQPYFVGMQSKRTWNGGALSMMLGIDLELAAKAGLDVPVELSRPEERRGGDLSLPDVDWTSQR